MEVFLLILRFALAGVFGVAGIAKLFDPAGSEKAFGEFGMPKSLAKPLVFFLPAAELLIAGSLLFVQSSWFGGVGAAGLLFIFLAGMLYQIAKGNAPDCHCFGQLHSEPVGLASVLRNVALLILAAFLVSRGRAAQGLSLVNSNQDIMQFVIGIAAVVLLSAVVFLLNRISDQQTQIMRRIELMELVARDGNSVERDDAGHPHNGLPIGAQFPAFELPDISGAAISLDALLAGDKPVLFFFVSPTCTPCKAMVPEFEQWQRGLGEKVNVIFVSNGKPDANIEKFGADTFTTLLLQKDRELAEVVRAKWTPTALLVDRNGRIASHIAAGDTAIRELVAKINDDDLQQEFTYFANGNGDSQPVRIGKDLPDFSIQDIKGREINTDYFKGKQTLITFWSLTCPHCVNMMDDLREWDKTKGKDEPDLIVFSDGEITAHEELELSAPIILDEGYRTAAKLGMFGTPSAVLVNEQGKIVSETAIGAPDIWSLVGKRK